MKTFEQRIKDAEWQVEYHTEKLADYKEELSLLKELQAFKESK